MPPPPRTPPPQPLPSSIFFLSPPLSTTASATTAPHRRPSSRAPPSLFATHPHPPYSITNPKPSPPLPPSAATATPCPATVPDAATATFFPDPPLPPTSDDVEGLEEVKKDFIHQEVKIVVQERIDRVKTSSTSFLGPHQYAVLETDCQLQTFLMMVPHIVFVGFSLLFLHIDLLLGLLGPVFP
nr:vegetative cell wall protein gp1-like [Arachis hypogaea]